jgi:indolepyruvate ferredoxin oxidoreductase beta subunit
VVTGVGGQGTLLVSRVLGQLLVQQGLVVTIGETLGLSQRGGTVVSQIRISRSEELSPVMAEGQAHVIVALEPVEGLRALAQHGNPKVTLVINSRPVYPIGVLSGEDRYPEREAILEGARSLCGRLFVVEASDLALRLGQAKLANMVMLGSLSGLDILQLDRPALEGVLRELLPAEQIALNMEAFDRGREAAGAQGAG